MYGNVEVQFGDIWCSVIDVSSLLLKLGDLNACLFGVDNYGGFIPLFPDRGVPVDCGESMRRDIDLFMEADAHPSWAFWSELKAVDWSELAASRDMRVTEYIIEEGGVEREVTKWLSKAGLGWVRESLDRNPDSDVRDGNRLFRRVVMRRSDVLADTEFPLLMELMACLAKTFGDAGVRIFVWFG